MLVLLIHPDRPAELLDMPPAKTVRYPDGVTDTVDYESIGRIVTVVEGDPHNTPDEPYTTASVKGFAHPDVMERIRSDGDREQHLPRML